MREQKAPSLTISVPPLNLRTKVLASQVFIFPSLASAVTLCGHWEVLGDA